MLIPVAGVDLVADDGVAIALDAVGGFGLIIRVRLFIDVVGRAEVERLDAEFTGEEALCEVELEVELARRNFADVRMREGVVADLVTFANDALHQSNILFRRCANHEECTLHVAGFKDVEDLWSPLGVGSVVEADGNLVGVIAEVVNVVGVRVHIHVLIDSEAAILMLIFHGAVGRFHFNGAGAIRWSAGDAENVSVAFGINVVPGHKLLQRIGSILAAGLIPHGPQRTIF